jgi:hypothetical protein
VPDDLPTARTTLSARYLDVLVWCKGGCRHQAPADLRRLGGHRTRRCAAEPSAVPLLGWP